jgi:hypothetical protein
MAGQTELLGEDIIDGVCRVACGCSRTGGVRSREAYERIGRTGYIGNAGFTGAVRVAQVYIAIAMHARLLLGCEIAFKMADNAVSIRNCSST